MRKPDDKGKDPSDAFSGLLPFVIVVPFVIFGAIVDAHPPEEGADDGDDGGKATCNGCGQEVDRKLITCSNCRTPVRYPLGTTL